MRRERTGLPNGCNITPAGNGLRLIYAIRLHESGNAVQAHTRGLVYCERAIIGDSFVGMSLFFKTGCDFLKFSFICARKVF